MSKTKKWFVILALVGVAAAYVYVYRDWFRPPAIEIYHRVSTARRGWWRWRNTPAANTPFVIFGLDRKVALTRVKVFRLDELATNSAAFPVWHLISLSNSVPLKGFIYGQNIGGMQPFVKGARPQPLISNLTYRLFIEAGHKKGQHDFSLGKTNDDTPPPGQ